MSYILHILTPYRYPILAALSLLLIAEMALAGVDLIPIEYEWALGWLMLLTIVAWAGIAVVVGVAAPAGGNLMKYGGRILLVLSPLALFAILAWPLLFLYPYMRVLVMVWIGMVVIVGATANVEHSKRTYLIMNVLPLSMLTQIMLSGPADYLLDDLFTPVAFLLNSLVIGAVLRRTVLPDKSWIALSMISLGISAVSFVAAIALGDLLIASRGVFGTCNDCPVVGLFNVVSISITVFFSLIFSVPLTILIGTMRLPIRNITVAGIGMAAMIMSLVWYYYLSLITM